jgi:hypothetical protein
LGRSVWEDEESLEAVLGTRGADVLVTLLGAVFRGILCSDRWVVYLTYHSLTGIVTESNLGH